MKIIVWGATGQAIVLRELLESNGLKMAALFDNDGEVRSPFPDVPVHHGLAGFKAWLAANEANEVVGIAAIGGARGKDRLDVHDVFVSHGVRILTPIHRFAFVACDAFVGEGSQIMALAAVCARASIGRSVLINTGAIVEHECAIGDGAHVGPGAVLAGCVKVEELAFVGSGAVVLPRITIGRGSTVGAGAVVTKDVPPNAVVVGNPARIK